MFHFDESIGNDIVIAIFATNPVVGLSWFWYRVVCRDDDFLFE